MPIRGKRHYHHVIAYETVGETRRGNPETYIFTLECGHKKHEFHSARVSMVAFTLSVIISSLIKKGKKLTKDVLPMMHCYECARGKPHTEDAVDLDKLIEEINAKIAKK